MIVPALKELKNVYWLHSNQAERAKFMMISNRLFAIPVYADLRYEACRN